MKGYLRVMAKMCDKQEAGAIVIWTSFWLMVTILY